MESFAEIDVDALAAWAAEVPWAHNQGVAMVNDRAWHGMGSVCENVVGALLIVLMRTHGARIDARNLMMSSLAPGATIAPHADHQDAGWIIRVHLPIVTNLDAWFVVGGDAIHMEAGRAYLVDTYRRHAVWNAGPTPRVHMMFDVFKI